MVETYGAARRAKAKNGTTLPSITPGTHQFETSGLKNMRGATVKTPRPAMTIVTMRDMPVKTVRT